jgi:putative solute:sodium symporter small subunit
LIAWRLRGSVAPADESSGVTRVAEAKMPRSDGDAPRRAPRRFPYIALLAWVLFALVVPRLVQALNIVDVLAFPLGFFMAAQGSLVALFVVAVMSARRRDRVGTAGDA